MRGISVSQYVLNVGNGGLLIPRRGHRYKIFLPKGLKESLNPLNKIS